ncbi:MAG: hypothetical protein AAB426_08310 [Myxococcota bacterium]
MRHAIPVLALVSACISMDYGCTGTADTINPPPIDPCAGIACTGHGTCAVTSAGVAICACDQDYHTQGLDCVSDANPCDGIDCALHGSCVVDGETASCDCNADYHAEALVCVADPVASAPTVSLSANPSTIDSGGTSTLTWSTTNATSCTASGAWSGAKATAGSEETTAITVTSSFALTCEGPGGSVARTAVVHLTGESLCDVAGYSTEKFNLTVPYCLDMRDDDYLSYPDGNPVAIANGGAVVTDEPTGSYGGSHCVKIVPPTSEDYAGLGNFNFNAGAVGTQMNVRYLVYWGYDTVQSGVKLNILNDGVSTRPMVISRELESGVNTTYAHDYMIPIPSQNVNEAPTIHDPGYPNNPSFFIADASAPLSDGNYAHQWVSWEFETVTSDPPILNLYIHTQDGVVAYGPGNPYATHAWNVEPPELDLIRASVGWYWGPGWNQTAEAYVKISDVVISDSYIGPPPGFVQ